MNLVKNLAMAFAILFIFACSDSSNDDGPQSCKLPENYGGQCIQALASECLEANGKVGQCQAPTYSNYCIDNETKVCVSATEQECLYNTSGVFDEIISFGKTCPKGYNSSFKACHIKDWFSDFEFCEPIIPSYYTERECRDDGYTVMDYGTCSRIYGMWNDDIRNHIFGSCSIVGEEDCIDEISQSYCEYLGFSIGMEVSFVPSGTCPIIIHNSYGSCTWRGYACVENIANFDCDEEEDDEVVFVSHGTCSTELFPYCFDDFLGECNKITSSYFGSKAYCFDRGNFLVNLQFCQEQEANIEE